MIGQLLLTLVATGLTVMIHAVGSVFLAIRFSGIWHRKMKLDSPMIVMPLMRLVSVLLLLHVIEMSVWAGVFTMVGVFPNFETSLYFSMTSYTTVGYGDVVPPLEWRLVGPIEAAVGVLMLGWSTGVFVAFLQRIYSQLIEPHG